MFVNSSSSFNTSLPLSPPYPHFLSLNILCLTSEPGVVCLTNFTILSAVVNLPLCVSVLYMGLQRWRQQRSSMTINHSDFFTYNMVAVELMGLLGFAVMCCGLYTEIRFTLIMGLVFFYVYTSGQAAFHILSCVERYVAVVYPIKYLNLRNAKWIKTRNVTTGCTWLFCFLETWLIFSEKSLAFLIFSSMSAFGLIVISFLCLSVLCVLTRPGPREEVGSRERVDPSKTKAFHTMMAIEGVLFLRFGGNMFISVMYASKVGTFECCVAFLVGIWLSLPSTLVLPVLFLHRARKLLCFRYNNSSGQGSE